MSSWWERRGLRLATTGGPGRVALRGERASLRLERVSVVYGGQTTALTGLSLRLEPGERVGFVGPSGAGKTTLLRLLSGTQRPTTGTVLFNSENLAGLSLRRLREVRRRIGTIHQDLNLVPNLRVLHNVLAGRLGGRSLLGSARLMLFPPWRDVERVHEILEGVGIGDKLYERTDRLSGGQRQRVAVARALFQEPSVLLADEPVSSVDPARARETVELLVEISRRAGLTLCMSLHNLDLAREFLPRLVGLRNGEAVFDRPIDRLDDEDFHALYKLEPRDPPHAPRIPPIRVV